MTSGPVGTAPLTFGQMSVWRDIDQQSRERWHEANVAHTFALPGPVSCNQLSQAMTRLCAKHESLRTIYEVADPQRPRQRLLPPEDAVEIEISYGTEHDAAELSAALASRAFDLSQDRPIRTLGLCEGTESAGPDEPNIRRVVLCVHHIACDGWSMGLLMMDLLVFLGFGGEEVPPAASSLFAIAEEQRSAPSWQSKLRTTRRHFRAGFEISVADFLDRDATTGTLQASIGSREVLSAARSLAETFKVSVASVFTAAFADAVGSHCGPGPVRIGLMSSNRFLHRWHPLVTSMNQLIPVCVEPMPEMEVAERLAAVQLNAMRAYRLSMFDVDQVTPGALGLTLDPSRLAPICILNVVESAPPELVQPEAVDHEPQLQWEPQQRKQTSGCYLRVYVGTDTVRLRLRTGGLAADTVAAIVLGTGRSITDGLC